jgi:CBS domain-containing protein
VVRNGGSFGTTTVYRAMDSGPLTCTMETDMDEVRRMMLDRHARYMPVVENRMLMGVISFYDVARAVVDAQNFENKMLKAYIRDWPEEEKGDTQ